MDVERLERELGASVRARRDARGLTRAELADLANVSSGAVKNLELGYGANVTTLVRVVHALDADDWLTQLTPAVQFDPFTVLADATDRHIRRRSRPDGPRGS